LIDLLIEHLHLDKTPPQLRQCVQDPALETAPPPVLPDHRQRRHEKLVLRQ
ncbi:hypothetical protein CPB97_000587, partial [Podila verticillata]